MALGASQRQGNRRSAGGASYRCQCATSERDWSPAQFKISGSVVISGGDFSVAGTFRLLWIAQLQLHFFLSLGLPGT